VSEAALPQWGIVIDGFQGLTMFGDHTLPFTFGLDLS
jgi:hypothetical protein